jgi:(2R)-3-sulfolactate dehydrogenase (NADP+)
VPNFTLPQLIDIAHRSLVRAGAGEAMAATTARACRRRGAGYIVAWHRAPSQYALHLRNGRADGKAVPVVVKKKAPTGPGRCQDRAGLSGVRARGRGGVAARRDYGVAFAGVTNSHHFGIAAYHLLPVAEAGMVGLAFGNSPAAMPAAGGRDHCSAPIRSPRCFRAEPRHR